MVSVTLRCDNSGCLGQLTARGHAGYDRAGKRRVGFRRYGTGFDPACAALSLILRSVAGLVAAEGAAGAEDVTGAVVGRGAGWRVRGGAPEPGVLFLEILSRPPGSDDWLRGVTDTLVRALGDVETEYPGSVEVRLEG